MVFKRVCIIMGIVITLKDELGILGVALAQAV
jgi:hypothetical protein